MRKSENGHFPINIKTNDQPHTPIQITKNNGKNPKNNPTIAIQKINLRIDATIG